MNKSLVIPTVCVDHNFSDVRKGWEGCKEERKKRRIMYMDLTMVLNVIYMDITMVLNVTNIVHVSYICTYTIII